MRSELMAAVGALALGSVPSPLLCVAQAQDSSSQAAPETETVAEADPVEPLSQAVEQVAGWVTASADNGALPFIVIDKTAAALSVYDGDGNLQGMTPALLGVANGDDSAPGIGDRAISSIKPEERTTPAGRFMSRLGIAAGGHKVLWVDYATSVAIHPVATANAKERRAERLRSPSPDDNRITYGCINIPARFYARLIEPLFEGAGGIVYILPETTPLDQVFPALTAQSRPLPEESRKAGF